MARGIRQTRWPAAVAAIYLLSCCSPTAATPPPTPTPLPIPADGVHITGAVDVVYPIDNSGACRLYNDAVPPRYVSFTGIPDPGGLTVNMLIAPFAGPATYEVLGLSSKTQT